MAGVEVVVRVWKEVGIQVVVLLSFTLQVILLVTAEIRRRKDSGVLRAAVWSAYVLADSTAIYALGHMSVTSTSAEHQLMALWAPFLLLHLGGQDSITAYAIEDNRLWLRHLQVLAVQVSAVSYVFYQSTILGSEPLLWGSTMLMFVVGVMMYAERAWALKCANASNGPSKNYRGPRPAEDVTSHIISTSELRDTEDLLGTDHILLNIPRKLLERPIHKAHRLVCTCDGSEIPENLFLLVEMQLSLMHDLFYSKSEVMHTWYGLCIRIISSVSTAVALMLFHWSGQSDHRHGYSRVDVAVTYVLFVGAIVLETTSLVRAIFSSWVLADMKFLRAVLLCVRRLVLPERRRWWSESIGQHNLFELYDRRKTSRSSRIARWLRVEDWWNTMSHSRRIPVSSKMKQLLVELAVKIWKAPMEREREVRFKVIDDELEMEELIIVWHIATDLYLCWYKDQDLPKVGGDQELVEVIEALSNYMLFLLVARPYMLSDNGGRAYYSGLCFDLGVTSKISTVDFVRKLQSYGSVLNEGIPEHPRLRLCVELDIPEGNETLDRGSMLGAMLIGKGIVGTSTHDSVKYIAQELWVSSPDRKQKAEWMALFRSVRTTVDQTSCIQAADSEELKGNEFGITTAGSPELNGDKSPIHVADSEELNADELGIHVAESEELVGGELGMHVADGDELKGVRFAKTVTDRLEMIASVWAGMLFEVGKNCGAYPHSKQLSNGGELLTAAAFLMAHLNAYMESKNADTSRDGTSTADV